ncbi:MAG TPA: hypothetical protein VNF29_11185 [Candidatus Binataceae bacterium]|nr:hypothetical protein [Candidatus Binataceae bacterium]
MAAMMKRPWSAAAMLAGGAMLALAGCSAFTPSSETLAQKAATANFDLAKCEMIESFLYRCPGADEPMCDPDFARLPIRCIKITKSGVLLELVPPLSPIL